MDANQFDQLTKTMAASTSRRRALGALTAGGLLGALGLGRTATAQGSTCTLDFVTTIRSGPTSGQLLTSDAGQPGEARGELSFSLSSTGALEDGSLVLTDGTSLPVVGQATGNSLNLRIDAGEGLVLVAIGVGEQEIAACQGAIDGLMTGPQAGDLGDWHAVATGQASSTGSNTQQPARAAAAGPVLSTGSGQPSGQGSTGPAGSGSCPAGQTVCAGACVDLSSNLNHCGACGAVCESRLVAVECRNGICERASCQDGLTYCGAADGCRDLSQDIDHCGACGNECPDGFLNCIDGICTEDPPLDQCEELGQVACDGICVDILNDQDNCGACGNVCQIVPTTFNCVAGVCTPPDCGPGLTDCSGLCDDLLTSSINCGTCGNICLEGQVCTGGVCGAPGLTCPPGQTNCFGTCTDTSNDVNNCGACGIPCPAGQVCQGNLCLAGGPACAPGQVVCGGFCTFTDTDFFNCGACGNACAEGQNCVGAVCTAA